MGKKLVVFLLCMVMVLGVTSCGESKKEKEAKEKAKQEEILKANQAKANEFVSAVEALPAEEEIRLKDETQIAGARALLDELTEEQKALVPADMITKLEKAEQKIEERRALKEERIKKRKADKAAAKEAAKVIKQIPGTVTLDSENAVYQARNAYSQLTDDQKKYVSKETLAILTNAEAKIQELKAEEARKAEEAKKAEEEKKAKEEAKKKKQQASKKQEQKADKYSIAKKYVGKKASALVAAIGSPKSKKKNPNCATDGEEYVYYYDGFYVGVLSQTKKSPLIVQNVSKN